MMEHEVRRVVREAVQETLKSLGIDLDEPFEVQKDFSYLRSWRKGVDTIRNTGLVAAVGIVVTGLLGLIWAKITGKI